MSVNILSDHAGWAVAFMSFSFNVYQYFANKQRMQKEHDVRVRAETDLASVRSRGEGPYLVPSQTPREQVYEAGQDGEVYYWSLSENVLCWALHEIKNLKANEPVLFVVQNTGMSVRRVFLKADVKDLSLHTEPDREGRDPCQFFKFSYEPEKHGKIVEVEISFETLSGYQDTHTYAMVYGKHEFYRIKPE